MTIYDSKLTPLPITEGIVEQPLTSITEPISPLVPIGAHRAWVQCVDGSMGYRLDGATGENTSNCLQLNPGATLELSTRNELLLLVVAEGFTGSGTVVVIQFFAGNVGSIQ